jgi:porin
VGGRGILPGRDNDTFGVGYYYSAIQDSRLSGFVDLEDPVQGFETFYEIALTPAAHVTFDAQLVESLSSSVDTAVILGLRLGLTF